MLPSGPENLAGLGLGVAGSIVLVVALGMNGYRRWSSQHKFEYAIPQKSTVVNSVFHLEQISERTPLSAELLEPPERMPVLSHGTE